MLCDIFFKMILSPLFIFYLLLITTFNLVAFASAAGRLRNCTAAAFASFKKYAAHFLNSDCVGTEPKDAAYAVTDKFRNPLKFETPIPFFRFTVSILFFYFKIRFILFAFSISSIKYSMFSFSRLALNFFN